jgi:hypothetical protein
MEMAQMTGFYQNQSAQQMHNASMIGMGMPIGDAFASGTMNRVGAVAGPLAVGALGLDPLSIGLSAGAWGASRGMGMMGAAGLGLGAGLASMPISMAVGYGVNQMFAGAQQQQAFGGMMNSTFRFANNYGGHGFGRGGLADIGSMMRNMSTEQGPAGQMVGFEELGRLASNMGRMGMAQGVRDAKDFSTKFREMVKTVKEIAEAMGTSLEEAQKMMQAMKGSGVFGNQNAAQFAQRIRSGAVAGGMATSELTGMMSVGSQISRMVGGRGRAGAAGGIETLTNIGVAQQMGLLSEEDVYNVTGLTGAEGRRAMATRQMEQSARFLQSSNGRRFLASIAGRDGQLDAGSVAEIMAGGVGTDRTMQMAGRNLSKIGRANFIRNEGRLRGAALEQFGGLAPMLQMSQWLGERGIDVNEGNDRAMVFMQRHLGMGNDEAEMMLRQVRELPQILRQRQLSSQDDDYSKRLSERKSMTGLEGIKNKFEKAKAEVNSALQQVGADIHDGIASYIEGAVNRMTDNYVKETRQGVSEAFRTMMGGGALGAGAAADVFGIGGGAFSSSAARSSTLFRSGRSDLAIFQDRDATRFAKAGFAFKGGDIMAHTNTVAAVNNAFRGGDSNLAGRAGIQSLGAAGADAFKQALLGQSISGRGFDRLDSFGQFLLGQSGGNRAGTDLFNRYRGASREEQAQIMAAYSGEGGAGQSQADYFSDPGFRGVYGVSGNFTMGEGADKVGSAFGRGGKRGMFAGSATSADTAVGKFLLSEDGKKLTDRMMSNNAKTRDEAKLQVEKEILTLQKKEDLTKEETARLRGLKGMLFAQRLTEMEVKGASAKELDAEAARLGDLYGISANEVRSNAATIGALAIGNKDAALVQASEQFGDQARLNAAGLSRAGLVSGSGATLTLNAAAADKLGGGTAGQAFLKAMVTKQQALSQMGPGVSADKIRELAATANNAAQGMNAELANMSVEDQRKFARALAGVEGAEEEAGTVGRVATLSGRLKKAGKGAGGILSAAGALGASGLDKEGIQKLLKEGGIGAVAKAVAGSIGKGDLVNNSGFMADLEKTLGSVEGGQFSAGGVGLEKLLGNETVSKSRLEKEAAEDPNKNLANIATDMKTSAEKLGLIHTVLSEMKERATKNPEEGFWGGIMGGGG